MATVEAPAISLDAELQSEEEIIAVSVHALHSLIRLLRNNTVDKLCLKETGSTLLPSNAQVAGSVADADTGAIYDCLVVSLLNASCCGQ